MGLEFVRDTGASPQAYDKCWYRGYVNDGALQGGAAHRRRQYSKGFTQATTSSAATWQP
ncbi:MAG: hypothetical protein ACLUW6_02965 [Coriobacteriaceae bacterium]